MRVAIDDDLCRGHGVCWGLCPQVFDLTDDGYSVVLLPDVPPDLEGVVRDAVARCPERAISVSDTSG